MTDWEFRNAIRETELRTVKHRLHRLAGHLRNTAQRAAALSTMERQFLLDSETQKNQRLDLAENLNKIEQWVTYLRQSVEFGTQMNHYPLDEELLPPTKPDISLFHGF